MCGGEEEEKLAPVLSVKLVVVGTSIISQVSCCWKKQNFKILKFIFSNSFFLLLSRTMYEYLQWLDSPNELLEFFHEWTHVLLYLKINELFDPVVNVVWSVKDVMGVTAHDREKDDDPGQEREDERQRLRCMVVMLTVVVARRKKGGKRRRKKERG